MAETLEADYLVVGAGAIGMAFTDALIDHADVRVVLIDRRYSVGGHWLDAYPFVRLHQASLFYGVPSTLLGGGRIQQEGPEAGLQERATAAEICAYYERVLRERLLPSGKVSFFPGCDYVGDGAFVTTVSGKRYDVRGTPRIVDTTYLAPVIPALTPPPFGVDGAHVIPVNDLVHLGSAPSEFVIVGSGKTATDAVIWLLANGVDPDAIVWVRPRDPWMLNRAVVQPDPAVFIGMGADTMEAAAASSSVEEMFLRLEDEGILLRIDRAVTPTMAKTPTLAEWELEKLRSIERVVRRGRLRAVESEKLVLDDGEVPIASDAVVVHCAGDGLPSKPAVPVWGEDVIRIQPLRSGFPCFAAGLTGFVEATIDSDAEKNRLCPPSLYGNSLREWCEMQVMGGRSAMSFGSNPDIKAWANTLALNPSRVTPEHAERPEVAAAMGRFGAAVEPGLAALARFAGMA